MKYKLFLEQARIANSACVPVVADTAWGDRFATDLPSFMADRITMEISWLPSQLGPDVEENSRNSKLTELISPIPILLKLCHHAPP